ncbi:ATP-binding protein [Leptolyngbya cf. ectocarpi LEGE 11479]|uniref:ATP-binding protein n=2 Tax=Leptolyngbya ectocarpi TaxID=1202 RepID=A0A928ZY29_LEPEC|nr:ATP-binding protein [Leptolyngbya cf. ectocarpi LEGE 11479]
MNLSGLGFQANSIKRWQPVIKHWKTILELELEEQKKLSQGELLNPFQYGNPLKLTQSELFKGRKKFAENIVRLLLDRNRPTIVLHGPRRCGKTSFLNNLPRLLPSNWLPIFIDIQSSAATANEISFLRSLARAIRRDGRSQGIKISQEPNAREFEKYPYDTFETWLETVLNQLGDRRLLINLDEFEKIGTAINQGKLGLSLFDELRSLIQHWDQLGFIFSGVQTLDEIGPNWSSYFISVVPVEMLYLESDEAHDLLTNPDPEFALTYVPGLVDNILRITQCHPNLLQLIGAALVTEANERYTQTATAEMLEAAIPRAFTLGTSYFTNVWTEFTGNPTDPDEIRAGQIVLKALAYGSQPTANDIATKSALRRMVRYHVLKENGGQYEFDIPLIKRWVKERAILDDFA